MVSSVRTVARGGPFEGLRVLDLSRILGRPSCIELLGDMGADILKIEKPGIGDETRSWGQPFVEGVDGSPTTESAYYLCASGNKRSIALDIANPDDVAKIRRIVRECDLVVESFKVGGLRKYGLDYDSLVKEKADLIYCSITGFGQTGPNAFKPSYDLLAQAYGGIMSLTGAPDGEPIKVGVGIADVVCGLYAATALLSALRHRDMTGEGQHIDIALVHAQISWLVNAGTNYLVSGQAPVQLGNQHPNIVPYQVFKVADGHVVVASGNDRQCRDFCDTIDRPDLANDPRFSTNCARIKNRAELVDLLSIRLSSISKQVLINGMQARRVPGGPINTLPEVIDSDQVASRRMRITLPCPLSRDRQVSLIGNPNKFSRTPVTYRPAPAACGQHTQEVLEEFRQMGATTPVQVIQDPAARSLT